MTGSRRGTGDESEPTKVFGALDTPSWKAGESWEAGSWEVPASRDQSLPLSLAQRRLWESARESPEAGSHFVIGLRLLGNLNLGALRAALDRIVERHEILRTTFRGTDVEPIQVVGPHDTRFPLVVQQLQEDPPVEQLRREGAFRPFDLSHGPLIRGRLIQLSEQNRILLITLHELICDDWSTATLIRELAELYCAYSRGERDSIAPLKLQYADYACYERQCCQQQH